ncbi:SDR family oxidoreductase [Paenibacillus abyssi]|uniref:Oxidoreductase n=1 Tax=Paenibacillus abyssi TaxID=1340531 RepID=A0A917FKX3_9BACL|nr:SDR family oxidoreductase [Paenibacillus abyssi]GGF87226.1 oxidoreductase [Paenibacillus abyssi]
MNQALYGKVAAITGGAQGIGKKVGEMLAHAGASVWSGDLKGITNNRVPSAGEISQIYLDITDENQVIEFFAGIKAYQGKIDVLINCAGVGIFKPIAETTLEEWKRVLDINVTGLFLSSREAFKIMKCNSGGRIINLSSIAGYTPILNNGVYGTSKYAVHGFSQILNEEGKEENIRVTTVFLGATRTEMTDGQGLFDPSDMLPVEDAAEAIVDIAAKPLHVRIDEIKIMPPKGILTSKVQ